MDISAYQHMNIRMSTRGKRPLRNLTPSDKIRAIQRIHNGETKASVSRDIGVPESTLRGWCKNEQKLRFMCRQLGAADQLTSMSSIENPPEKRPRFDNCIQTPKYTPNTSFDEFGYNRLPLNGLGFSSNGSNAILDKIALNEMIKKHMVTTENASKRPVSNISNQVPGMLGDSISMAADYSAPMSMMQNLNLLSFLGTNLLTIPNLNPNGNNSLDADNSKIHKSFADEAKAISIGNCNGNTNSNNSNQKNTVTNYVSLSVKNWAKDPAENSFLNFANKNNRKSLLPAINDNIDINSSKNDSNNNNLTDKNNCCLIGSSSDVSKLTPLLPHGLLQIPNLAKENNSDSDNGNIALLEWCKVFNASLNFLALAAAAAALQPYGAISNSTNTFNKEANILYKELTKTANSFDSVKNATPFIGSDESNDSYFDSEPEDLSVRSTTTSKLSSSANSRSESPEKSTGSCSPLNSDREQ